jgi:hypothetical protein
MTRDEALAEEFADAPPASADARVHELFRYWQDIHPTDGGLPGRAQIDPTAIPSLLPFGWPTSSARPCCASAIACSAPSTRVSSAATIPGTGSTKPM